MTTHRAHIFGAGLSGIASAEYLLRHGWMVIVTDDYISEALVKTEAKLRGMGAEVVLGGHQGVLGKDVQLVVVSPGVPANHPAIEARRRQGVEVIGELELGARYSRGRICAVTGSNGKSTTTALIGEIFRCTGGSHFTAGNIGTPLVTYADDTSDSSLIALEVSSYQLETTAGFKPEVGALLNITPDHLERHGGFEGYKQAKAHIWKNMTDREWMVMNADDPAVASLVPSCPAKKVYFSTNGPVTFGGFLDDDKFRFRLPTGVEVAIPRSLSHLPGRHNDANVLAAGCAALLMGIEPRIVEQGIREFAGLAHRLELVSVINGVSYVNDSKATNADAGRWALEATPAPIILIAGGRTKGAGYQAVRSLVADRVKKIFTIGEAAGEIEHELGSVVECLPAKTLDEAVRIAQSVAVAGDTVLLSPLCASFDQFKSFEHRGDVFRKLVKELS